MAADLVELVGVLDGIYRYGFADSPQGLERGTAPGMWPIRSGPRLFRPRRKEGLIERDNDHGVP